MNINKKYQKKSDAVKLLALLILSSFLVLACQKEDPVFNPDVQYGSVNDVENNTYRTVQIGPQEWMAENLRTTKYRDGTAIFHGEKTGDWSGQEGSYCWYNNDRKANKSLYGALYNWSAVNTGILCPDGWHVPDMEEWKSLENFLIVNGFNFDGTTTENRIAKSLATATKWEVSTELGSPGHTPTTNNKSGFSALPAGFRDPTHGWDEYIGIGTSGGWWTSTQNGSFALHCSMNYQYTFLHLDDYLLSSSLLWSYGFSVRCIKD